MVISITRRRLLQSTSISSVSLLAGCSLNPFRCGDHKAVVIRIEPVTDKPEDPIQIRTLPDDQQSFLVEAIEEGTYRACPYTDMENQTALQELAKTVGEHEVASESSNVYLVYQEAYYLLEQFRIEDVIIT